MLALLGAAVMATSTLAAPVAPVVSPAAAVIVHHAVVEDIEPARDASGNWVLRGEASITIGGRTVMYDLAGRRNNGALAFGAPRVASKRWNWYSAGGFTTVTWWETP